MSSQIHWHEGLFLQPHHLQMMQRGFGLRIESERRLVWPYAYGVVEATLLRDDMEDMRVRFSRLRAIMPSGTEVNFPDAAELPPLDIRPMFARPGLKFFDVLLGVPLWTKDRANTFRPEQQADPRVKLLYRLKEASCLDENTGENAKDIQFRMVNARLMLDFEDRSDMEVMPLLRIKKGVGDDEGRPRLDPEFAFPSLLLNASPALRDLVRALTSQVDATRDELDRQLHKGGIGLEQKLEMTGRLMLLSRFAAKMLSLVEAPSVPLYSAYLELRSLLAELAAFRPGQAVFAAAAYDHDNPYPVFKELDIKIRREIKPAGGVFLKVPFEMTAQKNMQIPVAKLTAEHFAKPNAYFLAVKTKADPTALARYVEDGHRFKLMPLSIWNAAIFGITLQEQRIPPLEFPSQAGLYYFLLQVKDNAARWDQIQNEMAMAINYKQADLNLSDAEFTLYMTVPS
jgi:type VI secretion system ImpJ/VasE family protein